VEKFAGRYINLSLLVGRTKKLPEELKESIIVPIHKKGDKTDCNNYRGLSILPNIKFYLTLCSQS